MRFVDEFRDPLLAQQLVQRIRSTATRRWTIMEVCGGQTHGLLRYGIDAELEDVVEMIHGPGCPVCVTSADAIDMAHRLAFCEGVVVASFGDMLRVPGSQSSLLNARAAGANVVTVYSPMDAVQRAIRNPEEQVVFFAVGFETTAPATALAVLQAKQLGLKNFALLVSHVRVIPAMEAMMEAEHNRIQCFLAAGHVCCITGYQDLEPFAEKHGVPVVVTGFEPLDLLSGLLDGVTQLEADQALVSNCYGRSVTRAGNVLAQAIVNEVYEVEDREWRGIGLIRQGGYRLRRLYQEFDATHRWTARTKDSSLPNFSARQIAPVLRSPERCSVNDACRAGEVLTGRLKPCDCPQFGLACDPDHPLGSPMVSSEGACAAYFRYHRMRP